MRFLPVVLGPGPSRSRTRIVGIIFCTNACARQFKEEVGADPLFYDFSTYRKGAPVKKPPAVCSCGDVLADERFKQCRLCRIKKSVEKQLLGEATRIARARAQKAARLVYRPLEDLPVIE